MGKRVYLSTIHDVAVAWLRSPWMKEQIKQHMSKPSLFTREEADDFATYLTQAQLWAPTHGLIKFPHNLIIELGLKHGGLVPGAMMGSLPCKFPKEACLRIDANRKLGISVMLAIVSDAPKSVKQHGKFEFLVHNASHFGFGGFYARMLADAGLISVIRNTSGRGNEVLPYGGDYGDKNCARMGTNPYTFGFPTKQNLGYHVIGDFATSSMSWGQLKRSASLGVPIKQGTAVDANGEFTEDATQARLLVFNDHHSYCMSLETEALAALMGGDLPWKRCIKEGDEPGGSADWIITVADPEYYNCSQGNAIDRISTILSGIVDNNGKARLPGCSMKDANSTQQLAQIVELNPIEYEYLVRMSEEGGATSFPLVVE